MPLARNVEPELMESEADALEYAAINRGAEVVLFFDFISGTPGPRVIDLGSGPGELTAGLCRRLPGAAFTAVENSPAMFALAEKEYAAEGLSGRVRLLRADAKNTALPAGSFDWVISNNLAHHLADPAPLFAEIARLCAPGAGLFIRDLRRPETEGELEAIAAHCPSSTPRQRELLRASLRAALRTEEAEAFALAAGLSGFTAEAAGPRHWELRRPRRALKV